MSIRRATVVLSAAVFIGTAGLASTAACGARTGVELTGSASATLSVTTARRDCGPLPSGADPLRVTLELEVTAGADRIDSLEVEDAVLVAEGLGSGEMQLEVGRVSVAPFETTTIALTYIERSFTPAFFDCRDCNRHPATVSLSVVIADSRFALSAATELTCMA